MDMSIHFPNLGIHWDYVGKSFSVFGVDITFYGVFAAAGMLAGIFLAVMLFRYIQKDADWHLDVMMAALIGGVIGARLLYAVCSWDLYQGDFSQIFHIRNGGLALYGGILGGALAAALVCRIKKTDFWKTADVLCIGLAAGQAVGGLGSLFSRENFGEYTDSLFAMQIPVSAVQAESITDKMRETIASIGGVEYVQVHPLFLYESLWCLLLVCFLLVYRRKKRFDGEVFWVYLAGFGLMDFFLEGVRADALLIPGTRLAVSQAISAVLAVIGVFGVLIRRSITRKREEVRKQMEEKLRQKLELEKEEAREHVPADSPDIPSWPEIERKQPEPEEKEEAFEEETKDEEEGGDQEKEGEKAQSQEREEPQAQEEKTEALEKTEEKAGAEIPEEPKEKDTEKIPEIQEEVPEEILENEESR